VIGLGKIGSGVALCLARSGALTAVYDIDSRIAERLEGVPANSASPADLTRLCDVVLIAVYDGAQAWDVLAGPKGILSTARPDQVVVLLSTVKVLEFRELEATAAAKGIKLLDCGVTGGGAAPRGELVSMIGGDDQTVETVRPLVEMFSKKVVHMGPSGSGMAAKIARNVIVYTTWRAEYEGVLLAQAAGVEIRKLIEVVEASQVEMGGSCFWARRDDRNGIESVDEGFRQFCASVLDKDLGAALQLSSDLGVRLPTAEIARATGRIMAGLEPEPSAGAE
jgi:3-hydroxyisobutyrate dehydrogenase